MKTRLTTEEVVNRFKNIHGDKFNYSLVDYKNGTTKFIVICNMCNTIFKTLLWTHMNVISCPKCAGHERSKRKIKPLSYFLEKQKEVHGNTYTYLGNYTSMRSKVHLKCNKCSKAFSQRATNHVALKQGCPSCSNLENGINRTLSVEEFEKECNHAHYNMYEYFQDYTAVKLKIKIKCKKCNNIFYQKALEHKNKLTGCPKCKFSKGELAILRWLEANNIPYVTQKTFPGCRHLRTLRFDFYLTQLKICIEYDGAQHFRPYKRFGGQEALEILQKKDQIKNDYCNDNNIKLIRIPYKKLKNISQILDKEIFNI